MFGKFLASSCNLKCICSDTNDDGFYRYNMEVRRKIYRLRNTGRGTQKDYSVVKMSLTRLLSNFFSHNKVFLSSLYDNCLSQNLQSIN